MGHVRHVGAAGLGEEGGGCRSQEGQAEPGERPHSLPGASCGLGAGNKTGWSRLTQHRKTQSRAADIFRLTSSTGTFGPPGHVEQSERPAFSGTSGFPPRQYILLPQAASGPHKVQSPWKKKILSGVRNELRVSSFGSPCVVCVLPVLMPQSSSWSAGPGRVPQAAHFSIYLRLFMQRTEFEGTLETW